jgi:release factor glutamine methyltransferase
LEAHYPPEEARAMTDRLFEYYFQLSPSQRVLSATNSANKEYILKVSNAVLRLLRNEPLQYILGIAYFLNLTFEVNSSVLIPRPETEELVTLVLKSLNEQTTDKEIHILDIGTGSGCIAIALKHLLPNSKVTAIDISEDALKVAARNARKNNVEVSFIKLNILDSAYWEILPDFDVIISNPPYITDSEKRLMQKNVLDHEPELALFVPNEDPLRFYKAITVFSKERLKRNGQLWFEINEVFGREVLSLFDDTTFQNKAIVADINGKDRFTYALK